MNQGTKQYDEFVFRRLTEPASVFGYNLDARSNWLMWVFILAVVLIVGLIYISIMYFRDSRGVGIVWALLLGGLRLSVYLLIAFIFLLPSRQSWEESSASSRVVVLYDVSQSMTTTKDDLPVPGVPYDQMPTRTDKLLAFLEDSRINFQGNLLKKNPVVSYRFASGFDGDFIFQESDGHTYTKEEYAELEDLRKRGELPRDGQLEKRDVASAHWRRWLNPIVDANAPPVNAPDELSPESKVRYEKLVAHEKVLNQKGFFKATNVGDATLSTITRETNNMVQGIVIFTDGKSTEGTEDAFKQIADRAKAANIPVFVVGIGEVRPQVRLDIADFRAPIQIQPEDKFRAVIEVTGEGLAEKEFRAAIRIIQTSKDDKGKEQRHPIYVIEQEDKKNPMKERTRIELGEEIVITPDVTPKFDNSTPPRAEIEFAIDAAMLAKAAKSIDLVNDPQYKGKKWEIGETGADKTRAFRLQAVVPKNDLELFADKEHKSDQIDLKVIKQPLRILLFASAATHDFQFLNNMLIREEEQQRAKLAVYVQPPPGKDAAEWRKQVVLGVKPEQLLAAFPDKYDPKEELKPEEKVYDLNEYDVIVAFDPDWSKLTEDQVKLVRVWSQKGGGIVMLGGPINTLQLARPGEHRKKLEPILELLPVVLKDVRIEALERDTLEPWPLIWDSGATPELEFLKLTEEEDKSADFRPGWNEFFKGKDGKGPKRGFYNYYPSELVKAGSIIVARFADPRAKMKDVTQMPYIVLSGLPTGHVVWIAWGETRRLRQHSEAFYERFWVKLLRYAGAGNQTNLVKRIRLDMNRTYTAGKIVNIEAKIDNRNGEPLNPRKDTMMPEVYLKLPAGLDAKTDIATKYSMVPKKGKDESDKGKFNLRFQVKSPGDYQLELKVPETGDSVIQKFSVKDSNPELDDTRPDVTAMYNLASEADPVLARMAEADRNELKKHLSQPQGLQKDDKPDTVKDNKARLYFRLQDAELIPSCMVTKTDTKTIRGPYKDLWDQGWDRSIRVFGVDMNLAWVFNALVLIVGLLSAEWLARKLLRLA